MNKFKPTKEQRSQVLKMASYGLPADQIATLITNPETGRPITDKTLREHCEDELNRGMAIANAAVVKSLFRKAVSNGPNAVAAAIFWTKARLGWRESNRVELTGANGQPLLPSYGPDADYVLAKLVPESVRQRASEAIAKAATE